jgi:DNA-binding IclR family transcriptional regulator
MKLASSFTSSVGVAEREREAGERKVARPARSDKRDNGVEAPADRYRAPALDKGLDILELLSTAQAGLTRTEIVRELGRSPSEIYRMLERLVARHYVLRSLEGDRYSLSCKLFALGSRHPPLKRLLAPAFPLMNYFAEKARQSCHLGVYDRGDLTIVAQVDSPDNWGLTIRLGAHIDLLKTGSGRVMLAFQDEAARTAMLREHAGHGGEDVALPSFAATLSEIRARGYWQGESLQARGVVDVSAPVLGPEGALAVLTCPFVQRQDTEPAPDLHDVMKALREVARNLSV